MKNTTITNELYNYLLTEHGFNNPVLLTDIYKAFPEIKESTIREYMRRFSLENKIIKIKNGIYGVPNPNRVLKKSSINSDEAINKKYIFDENKNVIGYRSGFYIANALRLTSQTPSIVLIYSNEVSNKRRRIKVQNSIIIINKARTIVTSENYKLLQILDLLNDFKKYSDLPLENSKEVITNYLYNINLSKKEIESIVETYPKNTQINFYKLGVLNEIT